MKISLSKCFLIGFEKDVERYENFDMKCRVSIIIPFRTTNSASNNSSLFSNCNRNKLKTTICYIHESPNFNYSDLSKKPRKFNNFARFLGKKAKNCKKVDVNKEAILSFKKCISLKFPFRKSILFSDCKL